MGYRSRSRRRSRRRSRGRSGYKVPRGGIRF